MSQFIMQNEGRYNLFCTISDSFVFSSHLTREQLIEYLAPKGNKSGAMYQMDFRQRLRRADEKGTSSILDADIEEVLTCNRCGENEAFMPIDECIRKFL